MWNFAKFDSAPLNSPLSLFSAPCHPKTVKHCNENPLPCHPFPLKLLPTCEYTGLQSHLHTPLSPHLPQSRPALPQLRPACPVAPRLPQSRPSCALPNTPSLPKVACNSRTGVTQRHEVIQTGNMSRGNCMRNCRAPHCAPRKVARNSPRTSFTNSSKIAEYQRSHFKTRNILKGITCEIARQRPV